MISRPIMRALPPWWPRSKRRPAASPRRSPTPPNPPARLWVITQSRAFPRRKALAMSQILADLVRAQRVRTTAQQLAPRSDPTPDGLEAHPGYITGFRAARDTKSVV